MLIMNAAAGAVNDAARRRIEEALGGFRPVDFHRREEAIAQLREPALVVAVGGDGTVAAVARTLIGTPHVLGIVPLGTFNNFARALDIPLDLEGALAVIMHGVTMWCSVGRAGDSMFLESAMVGTLARTIELGEALKELQFGELPVLLARHARAGRFRYSVGGDIAMSGWASSIVVANTPTTGALIPTGEARPTDATLELRIAAPAARGALGWLAAALLRRRPPGQAHRIRKVWIETDPELPAVADASEAGVTPIRVEVVTHALHVRVPPAGPGR